MAASKGYLLVLKWIMASKESLRVRRNVSSFCILWILGFLPLALAITSNISDHELQSMMKLLKKMNKPYVKSFKVSDKETIDCVPFHLQPAFDNPLLKNHSKIFPGSFEEDLPKNHSSSGQSFVQLWQTKVSCPKGTVPIRRTTIEDLIRTKSIQRSGKKLPHSTSPQSGQNGETHEHAVRLVEGGEFYGAKAHIGLWKPAVKEASEFSLSQIWVSAGEEGVDLNSIEAGWQVYYDLYGDWEPHLFGFWTRDAYRTTGCYNERCVGFVHVDGGVRLGTLVAPVSTYGGSQFSIQVYIYKDPKSGDWWLEVGDKKIGYWPASLFTHLRKFATTVDWGGEVVNRAVGGKHTTTQMGSGRFSKEGSTYAGFFTNLEVLDRSNRLTTPANLVNRVTHPKCYDLLPLVSDDWGEYFYYGGPGRNPKCR